MTNRGGYFVTNFHAVDGRKEFRFVVFGAPGSNHVASQLQRRTPKGTVFFQLRSPRASRLYTWYTPPCTKIRSGLDISSDSPLNLFKKAEKRAWNLFLAPFLGTFPPLPVSGGKLPLESHQISLHRPRRCLEYVDRATFFTPHIIVGRSNHQGVAINSDRPPEPLVSPKVRTFQQTE